MVFMPAFVRVCAFICFFFLSFFFFLFLVMWLDTSGACIVHHCEISLVPAQDSDLQNSSFLLSYVHVAGRKCKQFG